MLSFSRRGYRTAHNHIRIRIYIFNQRIECLLTLNTKLTHFPLAEMNVEREWENAIRIDDTFIFVCPPHWGKDATAAGAANLSPVYFSTLIFDIEKMKERVAIIFQIVFAIARVSQRSVNVCQLSTLGVVDMCFPFYFFVSFIILCEMCEWKNRRKNLNVSIVYLSLARVFRNCTRCAHLMDIVHKYTHHDCLADVQWIGQDARFGYGVRVSDLCVCTRARAQAAVQCTSGAAKSRHSHTSLCAPFAIILINTLAPTWQPITNCCFGLVVICAALRFIEFVSKAYWVCVCAVCALASACFSHVHSCLILRLRFYCVIANTRSRHFARAQKRSKKKEKQIDRLASALCISRCDRCQRHSHSESFFTWTCLINDNNRYCRRPSNLWNRMREGFLLVDAAISPYFHIFFRATAADWGRTTIKTSMKWIRGEMHFAAPEPEGALTATYLWL